MPAGMLVGTGPGRNQAAENSTLGSVHQVTERSWWVFSAVSALPLAVGSREHQAVPKVTAT